MESILIGAIVSAIAMKYRNLGFYRAVTAKISDSTTRQVFNILTTGESAHLEEFCTLYHGTENELDEILKRNDIRTDPYYCTLLHSIDSASAEFDALRIALRLEQSCIEWLTVFADIIRVPHIRDVFARVLAETNKRGDLIQEECTRLRNVHRHIHNRYQGIHGQVTSY